MVMRIKSSLAPPRRDSFKAGSRAFPGHKSFWIPDGREDDRKNHRDYLYLAKLSNRLLRDVFLFVCFSFSFASDIEPNDITSSQRGGRLSSCRVDIQLDINIRVETRGVAVQDPTCARPPRRRRARADAPSGFAHLRRSIGSKSVVGAMFLAKIYAAVANSRSSGGDCFAILLESGLRAASNSGDRATFGAQQRILLIYIAINARLSSSSSGALRA